MEREGVRVKARGRVPVKPVGPGHRGSELVALLVVLGEVNGAGAVGGGAGDQQVAELEGVRGVAVEHHPAGGRIVASGAVSSGQQ